MATVKTLAAGGVTICATIHSPTSYAFALFDAVMLLVKGRLVYFGARGKSVYRSDLERKLAGASG